MNGSGHLVHVFILRDLLHNPIRTSLSIIGIGLGVAVMLAIFLANEAALARFSQGVDFIAGKANFQIVPQANVSFDERILQRLNWLLERGVKFTPVIEQFAVIPGPKPDIVQVLGVDMFVDPDFRSMRVNTEGEGSVGILKIFRSGRIYLGANIARKYGISSGRQLDLLIGDRQKQFTVAGILADQGAGKVFGGNVALMDIGAAQEAFEMPGLIDHIDLIVPPAQQKEIKNDLSSILPASLMLNRPARRTEQVQKMVSAFQYNLFALSLIALLVGMFLIYNTMSVTVIRKRPEIGTMRVIGIGQRQILFLFSCQALLIGILGSLLGLIAGVAFSRFAITAVASTVTALYADQPPIDVQPSVTILLTAFFIGIGATLLAALGPVLEAYSVSAAEASRRSSYESRIFSKSASLARMALCLIVVAVVSAFAPPINGFPLLGYFSAAFLVFGVSLLLPWCLQFLLVMLDKSFGTIFGAEGHLALRTLSGALGRTSVTIASLMTGIAMMISLAIMIGSFRSTVIAWVNQTFEADIYIKSMAGSNGKLSQATVNTVRSAPGVEAVDAFIEVPFEYQGRQTLLGAGDLDVLWRYGNLKFLDAQDGKSILRKVAQGKGCVISESFASRFQAKIGDQIQLPSPAGPFAVTVQGIYYDYVSDLGYVVITRGLFGQHYRNNSFNTMGVYLAKGADIEQARSDIISSLPYDVKLNVRTNKELKVEILRIFDNTFAITYALHAIAILVAILGIVNSLFALIFEMRRELAILKYVGASDKQLRKMILLEATVLGLFGDIAGVCLGIILSFLLINVINKQSFGWTIQLAMPLDFFVVSSCLVLACSIGAGFLPAQFVTRTLDSEAIRAE